MSSETYITSRASENDTLSIIIVSYEVREYLRACLISLSGATENISNQIWVVENASKDGSTEMLREDFPQVRLIVNSTNRGFAAACNQALRQIQTPMILLVNPDTEIHGNALVRMIEFLASKSLCSALGPRRVNSTHTPQISCSRFPSLSRYVVNFTKLDRYLYRKKSLQRFCLRYHETAQPRIVDWTPGSCMLIRKSALEEIGLLDEDYFLYAEEVDWCRRSKDAGYEIWYDPEIEVLHYGGRSAIQISKGLRLYHFYRGEYLYFRKHIGLTQSAVFQALRLMRSLYSFVKACFLQWFLPKTFAGRADVQWTHLKSVWESTSAPKFGHVLNIPSKAEDG